MSKRPVAADGTAAPAQPKPAAAKRNPTADTPVDAAADEAAPPELAPPELAPPELAPPELAPLETAEAETAPQLSTAAVAAEPPIAAVAAEPPIAAPAAGDVPVATTKHHGHHGGNGHHKKHKAKIEHKVPGRIRLKLAPDTSPEVFKAYEAVFKAIPGIHQVKTKPETGSIILHYDPKREVEFHDHFHACCDQHNMTVATGPRPGDEIEEMARQIEAEAEFLAQRSELARVAIDVCKGVDTQLKVMSGNTVDLKIFLAVGLAGYTFFEIGAEAATPMWVTLALFSMNHFAELHSGSHHQADGTPLPAPALVP